MKNKQFFVILLLPVAVCAQQVIGTNFKQLALDAMASPAQRVTEEVTGPVADTIRHQTQNPNTRVVVEASVVEKLPEIGCKRVEFVFTMPNATVMTKDGKKAFRLTNQLNLCENGQPPENDNYAAKSKQNVQEAQQRSKDYSEKPPAKK